MRMVTVVSVFHFSGQGEILIAVDMFPFAKSR